MKTRTFSETLPFSRGPRKWFIALAMLAVVVIAPFALRLLADPVGPGDAAVLVGVLAAGFLAMFRMLQGRVRIVVDEQRLIVDLRPHGERRVYPAEVIRSVEEGYFSPTEHNTGWGSIRSVQPAHALEGAEGPGVWVEVEAAPRLFLPASRPQDLAAALEALMARRAKTFRPGEPPGPPPRRGSA